MKASLRRSILFIVLPALAACQGSPLFGPGASGTPTASGRIGAAYTQANLYVASDMGVTVYAPDKSSVLRSILKVKPTALAFDRYGNLYVTDIPAQGRPTVREFAARGATRLRVFVHDIVLPRALAFDAADDLYVASDYSGVAIYPPGTHHNKQLVPVFYPLSIILDSARNLYVGETTGPYGGGEPDAVQEFAANQTASSRTITDGISLPVALVLDQSGNLWVANQNASTVTVYAPGSTSVLRTIRKGIDLPSALAFDASGNLYVANRRGNSITVYAPGSGAVVRTIRDGIRAPKALSFDLKGRLYVANDADVTVYGPGGTSALRTISEGVSAPVALGFGP